MRHPTEWLWQQRLVRFGAVAVSCTLLQQAVMLVLVHAGMDSAWANGIGFCLSAQVNFALSSLVTWGDRELVWSEWALLVRWGRYNTVAGVALLVNVQAFILLRDYVITGMPLDPGLLLASMGGVMAGAIVSFLVNNYVTFRQVRRTAETEVWPESQAVSRYARQHGVAFFLPAFNEAGNLPVIVPEILAYFDRLDCGHTVIIVNDGSTQDDTYEVAERLANEYPGRVVAVHHLRNRGYGGALRTGMSAALATEHGLIAFCDADGQFRIESFGTLLEAMVRDDAHLSVGYRIARADSLKRRLMGRGWHWLSSLVLGFRAARDVDCGFKLFTREMLAHVAPRLRGQFAVVSPEIIMRARHGGFRIAEAGLTHAPRISGTQTGAGVRVVVRSLIQLFQLRLALRKEGDPVGDAQLAGAKPAD